MEFHHVAQAGLELLTSGDLPMLTSQNARIAGMSHHVLAMSEGPLSLGLNQFLSLCVSFSPSRFSLERQYSTVQKLPKGKDMDGKGERMNSCFSAWQTFLPLLTDGCRGARKRSESILKADTKNLRLQSSPWAVLCPIRDTENFWNVLFFCCCFLGGKRKDKCKPPRANYCDLKSQQKPPQNIFNTGEYRKCEWDMMWPAGGSGSVLLHFAGAGPEALVSLSLSSAWVREGETGSWEEGGDMGCKCWGRPSYLSERLSHARQASALKELKTPEEGIPGRSALGRVSRMRNKTSQRLEAGVIHPTPRTPSVINGCLLSRPQAQCTSPVSYPSEYPDLGDRCDVRRKITILEGLWRGGIKTMPLMRLMANLVTLPIFPQIIVTPIMASRSFDLPVAAVKHLTVHQVL
ncbi:hypothetical protein AAY473_030999 [Plecturocebus cupreus]